MQSANKTDDSNNPNPIRQFGKYAVMGMALSLSLGLAACGDKPSTDGNAAPSSEPVATDTNVANPEPSVPASTTETGTEAGLETQDTTSTDATAAEAPVDDVAVSDEPELAADAGQKLYDSHCQQCHQGGLLGAPKFGDKAAWASRIAQGKDTLYIHSAKGFNKMPAQATGDVSVAQVHAAVDYMVEHSS